MASIHKRENSPFWYAAFYLPDGRRTFRSTGTSKKRKALSVCLEYEKAARLAREGRLTEARARDVIASIYTIANQDRLPSDSIKSYLKGWLSRKSLEVADRSYAEYETVCRNLEAFLGAKTSKPVDSLTPRDAALFRDNLAGRVGGSTVNKYLKILRVLWNQAVKDGHTRENVFAKIDMVKAHKSKSRAFTMKELKAVLGACNQEWRGMVITGLYTGQRISDVSTLTWRQIDFAEGEIRFRTRKTGRVVNIPMAKPLQDHLLSLSSSDNPDSPVFPDASTHGTNTLSRQFGEILTDAGLMAKRTRARTGKGHAIQRERFDLGFHALRHTATSLLKNAGVSDVVTREIIGHESEAVSRVYTHIESDTLRKAINHMPDVTQSS